MFLSKVYVQREKLFLSRQFFLLNIIRRLDERTQPSHLPFKNPLYIHVTRSLFTTSARRRETRGRKKPYGALKAYYLLFYPFDFIIGMI